MKFDHPIIYDKKGIPIYPGDVIKIFHFVAALRRRRDYMYKQALSYETYQGVPERDEPRYHTKLQIDHLVLDDSGKPQTWFRLAQDQVEEGWEIVQGYAGVEPGQDFRDRRRK